MKKSNVAVDLFENTITITKAYYKKACTYGSAEYYEFRKVMSENEGFEVVFKISEKKTYKKLTFEVMEAYIKTQANSEIQLVKFAAVKRIAKTKNSLYPLTKKWFLNAYPEYKENGTSDAETAELEAALAAELDDLAAEDDNKVVDMPAAVNM